MKTIIFRKVQTLPSGLVEFTIEKPEWTTSVDAKLTEDPSALRQALSMFWFKQNPNDCPQDIEFKIEMDTK